MLIYWFWWDFHSKSSCIVMVNSKSEKGVFPMLLNNGNIWNEFLWTQKRNIESFSMTGSSFWQGLAFRCVMMVFRITRYKTWLHTLKTINSSWQPSHLSSTNHAVRVSGIQWWGHGVWFLLLLRQSPAVGTRASYFCPELQRALDI